MIKKKRHKRKLTNAQRKKKMQTKIRLGFGILIALMLVAIGIKVTKSGWLSNEYFERSGTQIDASKPQIDVELLTVNPYSRPGIETDKIQGIVVHYTANPGSTAMDNRNYFEGLKDSHVTKTSSNFIVGLEGEIVQCVPTWEVAYASNDRNKDTVSIECCHPDQTGKFTEETYHSMVQLCAWLCMKFDLDAGDVIRHYDVTGKNCPKYFVEDEKAWKQFKKDIRNALESAQ